jgi:hypothetical protein
MYPKVRLTGIETAADDCGLFAAEMLVRHLKACEKVTSLNVPIDYRTSAPKGIES